MVSLPSPTPSRFFSLSLLPLPPSSRFSLPDPLFPPPSPAQAWPTPPFPLRLRSPSTVAASPPSSTSRAAPPYPLRPPLPRRFQSSAAASSDSALLSSAARAPPTRPPLFSFSSGRFFRKQRHLAQAISAGEAPKLAMADTMEEEYATQAKLLKEFSNTSDIEKAWTFNSKGSNSSQAMFLLGQANLVENMKRKSILTAHVSKGFDCSVNFDWSPFPIELQGISALVPSPSGSKLLVVRKDSPTHFELWSHSMLQKEIHVPKKIHGTVFTDEWFQGISWNKEETFIAYVAEEPCPRKPVFDNSGLTEGGSLDNESGCWKGQGEYEEHWGETYSEKRRPVLFVLNIDSGEVRAVSGISNLLSVGQVVWAPSSPGICRSLVFVGWTSENGPQKSSRKLGIKYCYNRPCSLYLVRSPFQEENSDKNHVKGADTGEDSGAAVNLTPGISSAFSPRFSPDGTSLVFLSAKGAVDSGVHSATDSLHRINWTRGGKPSPSSQIFDVVPVVMCAGDRCFPGLYSSTVLMHPWLSDGCTMILCSYWGSIQVILSINTSSGKVTRLTPSDSRSSWSALALDGDNILAVSSSPVEPPQVRYGFSFSSKGQEIPELRWEWLDIASPFFEYSKKVKSLLASLKFDVLKIPIINGPGNLTEGAKKPIEAIFVTSDILHEKPYKEEGSDNCLNPLIVVIHGGPHSVSLTSYSKSLAFLAALGYNLLIVNYRGSRGFGEEALQSLPGKIGSQDVGDVLSALDYVTDMGLVDPSRVAVVGGSHGGFLTTHLIGQAPDKFKVAAVRNPVCNIPLMVGTSDIPDWCYVEAYGPEGKHFCTEAPSVEHLQHFLSKSPIAHLSKVKVPVLFLLGARDLRVPVSNGLQYARSLKEKGGDVKVIVFPDDVHGIERPQSHFESFLNIGVWFKKYCR